MEHEPVDVLIIGAGASGAAIAWSLLETRMRILCLEQGGHLTDAEYPSRKEDYELSRYAEFSCDPNVRGLKQDYPINSENIIHGSEQKPIDLLIKRLIRT